MRGGVPIVDRLRAEGPPATALRAAGPDAATLSLRGRCNSGRDAELAIASDEHQELAAGLMRGSGTWTLRNTAGVFSMRERACRDITPAATSGRTCDAQAAVGDGLVSGRWGGCPQRCPGGSAAAPGIPIRCGVRG